MYPLRDWVTCVDGCVSICLTVGATSHPQALGGQRKRLLLLKFVYNNDNYLPLVVGVDGVWVGCVELLNSNN